MKLQICTRSLEAITDESHHFPKLSNGEVRFFTCMSGETFLETYMYETFKVVASPLLKGANAVALHATIYVSEAVYGCIRDRDTSEIAVKSLAIIAFPDCAKERQPVAIEVCD